MSTKVTVTNTYTTHRVVADITGAESLSHPYASKRWMPQWIRVEYNIYNGQWVAQGPHMSGVFVKSDGTPGQQRTRVDYYYDSVLPQWVTDFIAANFPTLGVSAADHLRQIPAGADTVDHVNAWLEGTGA